MFLCKLFGNFMQFSEENAMHFFAFLLFFLQLPLWAGLFWSLPCSHMLCFFFSFYHLCSSLSFRFRLLRKYLHMPGRAAQTQLKGFSKLIGFNYFGFSNEILSSQLYLQRWYIYAGWFPLSSTLRDFAVHCIRVNLAQTVERTIKNFDMPGKKLYDAVR